MSTPPNRTTTEPAAGGAGVQSERRRTLASLRAPAILLGVGLGGFFDGIVFHQIFQFHHMLSNTGEDRLGLDAVPVTTLEGLQVNTLWDGLFHLTTYAFVLIGLHWMWSRYRRAAAGEPPAGLARPPWTLLNGGLLAGWGIFNLVEGVVDHHLLAVHHVYDAGDPTLTLVWDLLFLAAGAGLLAVGWWMMRRAVRRS